MRWLSALLLFLPVCFPVISLAREAEGEKIELKDGSRVEVDGAEVFILKDDRKIPAPDGTHEAKDGRRISTRRGKKEE